MHDLSGGVLQCVLQVVLEVAEKLAGSALHHVQKASAIVSVHIWRWRTFSQSELRDTHTQKTHDEGVDRDRQVDESERQSERQTVGCTDRETVRETAR